MQKDRRKGRNALRRQHTFIAYLLIGIGLFYLLKQIDIPILHDFYGWPTILMIIGVAFLLHSFTNKDYQHLFTGTFMLGLGIHFHGLHHYSFWVEHWSIYILLIGVALIVRSIWTKSGFIFAFSITLIALFLLFNDQIAKKYDWSATIMDWIQIFWPVIFIVLGFYLLKRK